MSWTHANKDWLTSTSKFSSKIGIGIESLLGILTYHTVKPGQQCGCKDHHIKTTKTRFHHHRDKKNEKIKQREELGPGNYGEECRIVELAAWVLFVFGPNITFANIRL